MDWKQIFSLPEEIRKHVVVALQHPKLYADKLKDVGILTRDVAQYVACNATITFIDDYLLLGSKMHNRPLLVTGYIKEQKVKHILVDGGSAINIMPKSIINDLGITVDDLPKTKW